MAGTVLDGETLKPVPAALVIASRAGIPPFTKSTKSGADGAFQIQGLTPGSYALCVQAPGERYLDPCQWNSDPTTVTLASGQNGAGISLRLARASVVTVQVKDAQNLLTQLTKDGRIPDLSVGVWGPGGPYYPARFASRPAEPGVSTYNYRLAVPRDTTLKLYIASRDLKLGDSGGAALATNSSQQTFQQASADANPKSFTFTVLGHLP